MLFQTFQSKTYLCNLITSKVRVTAGAVSKCELRMFPLRFLSPAVAHEQFRPQTAVFLTTLMVSVHWHSMVV